MTKLLAAPPSPRKPSRQQRRAAERARSRDGRRGLLPGALSAGAAIALGMGLTPSEAHAASYEVTNLDDSGPGSLRQALADANALPGLDTITFQADLSGTITLLTGELAVVDSVDIQGPGPDLLTVSGNDASRVFSVNGYANTLDVVISGLTIAHGSATAGAGIQVVDENLVLDDVVISDNVATGKGGGLWVDGRVMEIAVRNSVISGNTSGDDGGGIYIEDTGPAWEITNTRITGNSATGSGGGIYLYDPDGDVTIQQSTISGNTASETGGGIYLYNMDTGTLTIRETTISGNTAAGNGGGVYLYNADDQVAIVSSTISGNTSTNGDGGGIFLHSLGTLSLAHSTVVGNTAGGTGGGVVTSGTDTLDLDHTVVADNTATTADNDISGSFTLTHSLVEDVGAATTTDNGGSVTGTDPQLGALADNGGPTQTHLPASASPAVNSGDAALATPPASDQRGRTRVVGSAIDMGALERNAGTIQFASATRTATEGDGTITFTLTRSGGSDGVVAVTLGSQDDTATDPEDYTSPTGTVQWANQDSANKNFDITIEDDDVVEAEEAFSATIATPTNGALLGATVSAEVTLSDDDVSIDAGAGDAGVDAAADSGSVAVDAGVDAAADSGSVAVDAGVDAAADSGSVLVDAGSAGVGGSGGSGGSGGAAGVSGDSGVAGAGGDGGGGGDDGCGCSTVGVSTSAPPGAWASMFIGLAALGQRLRRRARKS